MKTLIITIDGPAASGKGTIAKFIKKKFNFFHIDSGLLYRKIAKIILDKKINIKNSQEIEKRGFFIGLPTKRILNSQINNLKESLLNIKKNK